MLNRFYSKNLVYFILIVIISGLLLQSVDSGIMSYFETILYIRSEGASIVPLIAIKFIFMGAITFLLMAKNTFIRRACYLFSFLTIWLSSFNLLVNNSSISEGVIRVALGDVSTHVYLLDVLRLF